MPILTSDTESRGKVGKNKENLIQKNTVTEENTGPLFYVLVFLTALLIMAAIFGGTFFVIIHNNINGLGERLRKDIQDIPLLKLALPEAPDPLDEKYMSEAEVRRKYTEMRKNLEKLKKELETARKKIKELEKYAQSNALTKAESEKALKEVETQKALLQEKEKKLEEDRQKLNELAAQADKTGYREFYEQLNGEAAEKIYREIVQEEKVAAEVKNFVQIYENMDASDAAKVFEELGTKKIDLVVEIIKNMKKEKASEILGVMNPARAAEITEKLAAYYIQKR